MEVPGSWGAGFEQYLRRCRGDALFFIRHECKLVNKARELVAAVPVGAQLDAIERWSRAWLNGESIQEVVLKGRQSWITHAVVLFVSWLIRREDNFVLMTLANKADTTKVVASKYGIIEKHLSDGMQAWNPVTRSDEGWGITWANGSSVLWETAGQGSAGRSPTLSGLHTTEGAYFPPSGVRAMDGALPALTGRSGQFFHVDEGTGNGPDGWFAEAFEAAREGKTDDRAVFYPFSTCPEYRIGVGLEVGQVWAQMMRAIKQGDEDEREACAQALELDKDERRYIEEGVLTEAEVWKWRRWAIRAVCKGKVDKFRREYPLTPEEALGSSVFSFMTPEIEARLREGLMDEPLERMDFDFQQLSHESQAKQTGPEHEPLVAQVVREGRLKIWDWPKDGTLYVLGADVSEGIGLDENFLTVRDAFSGDVVATWYENDLDPFSIGDVIDGLGRMYCGATLAAQVVLEITGSGLSTLFRLKQLNYPSLYHRLAFDEEMQKERRQVGWKTSSKTKPFMLELLQANLARSRVRLNDPKLLRQLKSLSKRVKRGGEDVTLSASTQEIRPIWYCQGKGSPGADGEVRSDDGAMSLAMTQASLYDYQEWAAYAEGYQKVQAEAAKVGKEHLDEFDPPDMSDWTEEEVLRYQHARSTIEMEGGL